MKPKVHKDDKIHLWKLLADGKWHKAKDIVMRSHYFTSTRIIRAICENEPDKFISTQAGYKRADLATDDELTNAINDLRSRARKMTERADAIEKALWERSQPSQLELVK